MMKQLKRLVFLIGKACLPPDGISRYNGDRLVNSEGVSRRGAARGKHGSLVQRTNSSPGYGNIWSVHTQG